jgi:hypothetical protein
VRCSFAALCVCAACERHNETDKALDLLECMHRAGFAASYANYSSIIMQVLLHDIGTVDLPVMT